MRIPKRAIQNPSTSYTGLSQKEIDIVRQLDIDEQTRKRIHATKEKITESIYIMPWYSQAPRAWRRSSHEWDLRPLSRRASCRLPWSPGAWPRLPCRPRPRLPCIRLSASETSQISTVDASCYDRHLGIVSHLGLELLVLLFLLLLVFFDLLLGLWLGIPYTLGTVCRVAK